MLAKLVYAYPKIPKGSFFGIGAFQCEILRRVPVTNPHAGDVLPLLAINAHDCLAQWGDPVKNKTPKTVIDVYDNPKVDACLGRAAKAIVVELLKP